MTNKKASGGNGNGGASSSSLKQSQQRSQDSQDFSSFKTVLFYCLLIVFLPVVTFFALKGFVLDSFLSMTEMSVNIASAAGAVVALHLALGLYIYRAYFGPSSGSKKQD